MRAELLDRVNAARAAKRRTCLVRYLDRNEEALWIDGETVAGTIPDDVATAIAAALRRDRR